MPHEQVRRATVQRYGGPDRIHITHEAPEAVGAEEVRIQVEASSLTYTDSLIRRGTYPGLLDRKPPVTLGYDLVGTVTEVGYDADSKLLGTRVAALTITGANADSVVRPAAGLVPIPDGLDPVVAESLTLTYLTAHQMLTRYADAVPGSRVLVTPGTGGVGTALLQLCQIRGIEAFATASAGKLTAVLENGGTPVDREAPGLDDRLREIAGTGFDAIFDGVAGRSTNRSWKLLAPTGTLVTYGAVGPMKTIKKRSPLTQAVLPVLLRVDARSARKHTGKQGTGQQVTYNVADVAKTRPSDFQADLGSLMRLATAGELRPRVQDTITLGDIAAAHTRIDAGDVAGRLVLVP